MEKFTIKGSEIVEKRNSKLTLDFKNDMGKWADYLISEVSYGKNHQIEQAKIHTEDEDGISSGTLVARSQISHNIKNGKTYKTIFHSLNGWKEGDSVQVTRVGGDSFIRIDKNKFEQDFLGSILRF